jgi:hypothetical protein
MENIESMDALEIAERAVSVYSLLLVIVGTAANGLLLYLCLQKKLRSINTFKLFAFVSISDTLSLYGDFISYFLY